jgi:hypothetical protein
MALAAALNSTIFHNITMKATSLIYMTDISFGILAMN